MILSGKMSEIKIPIIAGPIYPSDKVCNGRISKAFTNPSKFNAEATLETVEIIVVNATVSYISFFENATFLFTNTKNAITTVIGYKIINIGRENAIIV